MKHLSVLIGMFLSSFFAYSNNCPVDENVKKVVLQAFWWNCQNDQYPDSWANYLADLAPVIKELGFDAVWIPPTPKSDQPNAMGYQPFDHYDLGDKYQKEFLRTKLGTKDELLRMIAIMHANGIEVIQDIVLGSVSHAGSAFGAGGQDNGSAYSLATAAGLKNFRYVSYGSPAISETGCTYAERTGRWEKNAANFHPHPGHMNTTDDWTITSGYSPDLCYGFTEAGDGNGYGISSNICSLPGCSGGCSNAPQTDGYNFSQARNWISWYKKQTGVDGFRWEGVQSFPYFVQQDLSFQVKYGIPNWAAGGLNMLNFGDYIDVKAKTDQHVLDVAASNFGTEKLMGAMDWNLRGLGPSGGLQALANSMGSYDLTQLPGEQGAQRYHEVADGTKIHRSGNFVNSHMTFRPYYNGVGDYNGWDTASEVSPHVEPGNPWMIPAYAAAIAMDGNPIIYFEDIFNLGYLGNRFNHVPTNQSTLPINDDIINLIWCHQNLGFKNGDYRVADSSPDHLVISRDGAALIGINDHINSWVSVYIANSGFPTGTVLYDYSGANGINTVMVDATGGVTIDIPPVDSMLNSARRNGYAVWAPDGQLNNTYYPCRSNITVQEWEMADDLGDSHCQSLGQGGIIPNNTCLKRTVGKIFVAADSLIVVELSPTDTSSVLSICLYDLDNTLLETFSGQGDIDVSYFPVNDQWITIKVGNDGGTGTAQPVLVKATYQAPTSANTILYPSAGANVAYWTGAEDTDWFNCRNWAEGLVPNAFINTVIPSCGSNWPIVTGTSAACADLTVKPGAQLTIASGATLSAYGD